MFSHAPESRERRREVEEKLAEHGLVQGPSRLTGTPPLAFDDERFAARLGAALEELGPVFAALGRYLSTRLDLVTVPDALELSKIADAAPPLAPERVVELLGAELGDPAAVFRRLDLEPSSSTLARQTHRAELATGEPVLARLYRDDLAGRIDRELEAAAPLERVFGAYERRVRLAATLDELRRELAARCDPRREAEALGLLAADAAGRQPLAVPRVRSELTRDRLLVIDDLGGREVSDLVPRLAAMDREDLARRLCLVWLRQALLGSAFPVEAEVRELADGRLAFTGGVFASLPATSQARLWNYLRATAAHDPDQAVACLRPELVRGRRAVSDGELRSRLRQVVPFRDGGWSPAGENLAEYAVLHWRVVREYGYRAPGHLVAFYRGLFWAACTSQPGVPANDPLHDALDDLDWIAGWNQLRQLATPDELASTLESYLVSALHLPPKLQRALEIAGDEQHPGFRVPASEPRKRRRGRDTTAAVAALLMAMVAVALMAPRLAALAAGAAWAERLTAGAFAVFALALLFAVTRRS